MDGWRTITVGPEEEFRFEVSFENLAELVMVSGCGEIFGCELAPNKTYKFQGCKNGLFSYQGCKIRVRGEFVSEYVSTEAPNHSYMNLYLALEREKTREHVSLRILTLGSGRNSLNRILINYAVRNGECPMWVDLDMCNGNLLFPGALSAMIVDRVVDPEGVALRALISYFYGHGIGLGTDHSPGVEQENPKLYQMLMERLSGNVNKKLDCDDRTRESGLFVTGFRWTNNPTSFELVENVVKAFSINLVLVIGNEKLQSELHKKLDQIKVLKVPKSGGVTTRDLVYRRQEQMAKLHRYFYGLSGEYVPFSISVSISSLQIRKIGGPVAPSSALPLGATRRIEENRIVKVELSSAPSSGSTSDVTVVQPQSLVNSVLAVSQAEDESFILEKPVLGYVCITEVDLSKNKITLLTPSPGKLPSPYLILGNFKFIERPG